MKSALITGITGQDGSYLAEFLLEKGYRVFGLERRSSQRARVNIQHLLPHIELCPADMLDEMSLFGVLEHTKPNEVYNLAAQSFVGESWNQPIYTGEVTGLGAVRLLEAVRRVNPKIKFYQASSSEMFGATPDYPQNEDSRFHPRSPYAAAKAYAHYMTINYRESYNMFAVCGILFNHESPRRGIEFVTRKITHTLAQIKCGVDTNLQLGNMGAQRDWGFAGDYVEAMWLMLQRHDPKDYVIATGETHSVKDFVDASLACLEMPWKNITENTRLYRPSDVTRLCGDASRAHEELGWKPKVSFEKLVAMMAFADLAAAKKEIK